LDLLSPQSSEPLRLLIVIEAASVTGPVKNMLAFLDWTRTQEALALAGPIEPTLATYSRAGAPKASSAFIDAVTSRGFALHLLAEKGRFDHSLLPALRELAHSVQPHILQSHNVKTNFLIKAAGLHRRFPWISFQHGYTATDLKMLAYNQLDRWSLRSARRVVTVCQAFVPRLVASGVPAARIRVLHNSVSPFVPPPAEETLSLALRHRIDPAETVLLTIGRFSKEKGLADLITALATLRRSRPHGWRAVLLGEGPEQPRIEALIASNQLEHHVLLPGFDSRIGPWLDRANFYVLPSISEGSPNVILEAMAAKVPIAATRAGGTPEILTHDLDALLSPVGDPRALAANLLRLLEDPALGPQLAANALATVSQRFTLSNYRRNLLAIYRELLAESEKS